MNRVLRVALATALCAFVVGVVTPPASLAQGTRPAKKEKVEKPDQTAKKTAEKKEAKGHPELPSLPKVIHTLAPDSAIGKFMTKMHFVRPLVALLILVIITVFMTQLAARRSVLPGRVQTAVELVIETLDNTIANVLGPEHGRKFLPFLGTLFVYILALNLFGLVPLGLSPTAFWTTTGALALATFLVTWFVALTKLGIAGILYHWAGEPKDLTGWLVAPILFPLHMAEDLIIKPGSLALRLFGNIFGEDVLLGSMMALGISMLAFTKLPIGVPLHIPFIFVAMLASTIQALVFTLLSAIYIYLVLPHHDDEEHGHAEEAPASAEAAK